MIHPRTQKPQPEDQRRLDIAQALVEIGAVLFGDVMQGVGRERGAGLGRKRIEIADHRLGGHPVAQQHQRPAVGRHRASGPGLRQRQVGVAELSATDKQDRRFGSNDGVIHGFLAVFREKGHNLVTK